MEEYEEILVEQVVMGDPELPGTVLRLPAVYGPGDHQHRLFEYLKRMDDKRPAILLGEVMASWRWTHAYVEDVPPPSRWPCPTSAPPAASTDVGEADPPPRGAGWVRGIGRTAGWDGEMVVVPEDRLPERLDWGLGSEQHWVADTRRIRRELGYRETVPRGEALRRSVEWEREHPPEKLDPTSFDYAAQDAVLAGLVR